MLRKTMAAGTLVCALVFGLGAPAQSQDLAGAIDGLREFKPNTSWDWEPAQHARYYAALEALDHALGAAPDGAAVAHWFGAESQGKETPVSLFLQPRFVNNFAAGPLLNFEKAVLFEMFLGVPWALAIQDLAGCAATPAFAELSGNAQEEPERLGAIHAAAAAMQFSLGAQNASRRAILNGQEPYMGFGEAPDWYLPLQKQQLMADYIFYVLFDLPSEPFGQRDEADLLFDNTTGAELPPALLEAVKSDMPPDVATAMTEAGDYYAILEPIFELRDEAATDALCAL